MATVLPGNERVIIQPGEEVIDICRVTSCVTIQPGNEVSGKRKTSLFCRMENLKFEPKHNLVACLDETIPETEGLIKSFWRTAEVVTDEAGVIVVRGNITRDLQLTVSEESIRTSLRIDDDEIGANDELTTTECQACFVNMGHPPVFPKS
ncbi:hypothetical protein QVD17_38170 [Tagetes erecta]|uniref:Uncharacterized protein n=1 Tax=Tagetes erecta TaxID=13708 RepID=A0AAD8JXM5_TARER|nr:hypothetical protein QVD17_38170 [Tagetes erecta]